MIMVKTHMRKMPRCCAVCKFYCAKKRSEVGEPVCKAMSAYQPWGRLVVARYGDDFTQPTKGRQKWCPLKEEPHAAQD